MEQDYRQKISYTGLLVDEDPDYRRSSERDKLRRLRSYLGERVNNELLIKYEN